MSPKILVRWSLCLIIAAALTPSAASAYVGPGGVVAALGAALALLVATAAAIAGFVWYPVRRLLSRVRGPRSGADADGDPGA